MAHGARRGDGAHGPIRSGTMAQILLLLLLLLHEIRNSNKFVFVCYVFRVPKLRACTHKHTPFICKILINSCHPNEYVKMERAFFYSSSSSSKFWNMYLISPPTDQNSNEVETATHAQAQPETAAVPSRRHGCQMHIFYVLYVFLMEFI